MVVATVEPENTMAQVREKCKQRMDNIRKEQKRILPMIEQLDLRNPQNLVEFAQDIVFSMIEKEN